LKDLGCKDGKENPTNGKEYSVNSYKLKYIFHQKTTSKPLFLG